MAIKNKKNSCSEKVGIFCENWMESTLLAHGLSNCYLTSWAKGQIVWNQTDIERLISLNAPLKVYVEYVDGCAEG